MARKYTHLLLAERKLIGVLRMGRKNMTEIAAILRRSKSTISHELRRFPHHGNYEASRVHVSYQCIYDWLHHDRKEGGRWRMYLRINRPKRRPLRYRGRPHIPNRIGIEQRPDSVATWQFYGDWEGDTVHGKRNTGALVTVVERKSRFTVVLKLEHKRGRLLNKSLIHRFSSDSHLPLRTLTLDNGTEFTAHEKLSKGLGIQIYFSAPYCAWQRGLNENTNGLLRQYFPRNSDFRQFSSERVAEAEQQLNNKPRKCLGYRTPQEVMAKHLQRVGRCT